MPALRMPRKGPAARIAEQAIEALIPGLLWQDVDILTGMGEADQEGTTRPTREVGKSTIIMPATATKTLAMSIEGDQRQTDGVEGPQAARQTPRWLPEAEAMPGEASAMAAKEQTTRAQTGQIEARRQAAQQRLRIDLTVARQIGGDVTKTLENDAMTRQTTRSQSLLSATEMTTPGAQTAAPEFFRCSRAGHGVLQDAAIGRDP